MPETDVRGLLEGRRALVTGGARGLGYAEAELMREAGAEVMIADINEEGAREAAEQIGGGSPQVQAVPVDIRDLDQIDRMVEFTVEAFGGIDILVNNAAHARFGLVLDLDTEDWDYSYEVGLRGNFFCMQRVARVMVAGGQGGKVINVSSMTVPLGHAKNCAYSSMKGGVDVMTRVAAVELAQHNIQVNAVAPGPVDTPLARSIQNEWGKAQRTNHLPTGKYGQPPDVAGTVVFLSSGLSDWVTGAVVPVDGGYTATGAVPEPTSVSVNGGQ